MSLIWDDIFKILHLCAFEIIKQFHHNSMIHVLKSNNSFVNEVYIS